jgi:hypothetical protein
MNDLVAKVLMTILVAAYVLWFLLSPIFESPKWKKLESKVENIYLVVMAVLSVLATVWIIKLLLETACGIHSMG